MKIGVSFSAFSRKNFWEKMGVWVAFLKQPALLGEAPQTKKIKKSQMNQKLLGGGGAVSKKRPKPLVLELDIPFHGKF
jgi:hypothetical protein